MNINQITNSTKITNIKKQFVIIGGGISGLYTSYHLLKRGHKVIILEKDHRLGGRIFTFSDKSMTVDAGAARFREDHTLFIQLLKDLGLWSYRVKNSNKVGHVFIDSLGVPHYMNSIVDYDILKSQQIISPAEFIADEVLDIVSNSGLPNVGLVARIIAIGAVTSRETLISMSFIDFAKTVLDERDVEFLLGSFGYYSELVLMNAFDCLRLINELDPRTPFYSLRGGLSLVIDELSRRIRSMGGVIRLNAEVLNIIDKGIDKDCSRFSVSYKGHHVSADAVVCALRKKDLSNFSIFKPIMGLVKGILTAPLCRIYARYPVSDNGPWFKGIGKLTINNELRMVIPISEKEGIIMISYCDNKFAEFWDTIYKRGGEVGLNRILQKKIGEALNIDIPDASEIRAFYWEGGVGYWGVGIDSESVSRRITRPFSDKQLFVCGENFSTGHQQWIEGALETSSRVIDLIDGL